jgi:NADPH-dependent 2,4-dienoyl-CoA reductase/sulfur reductase-like enzyme
VEQTVKARNREGVEELPYDRLLIATGAEPIVPPWEGVDLEGVTALRTLIDARFLVDRLGSSSAARGVIIGGGYVGLEMAEALGRRGLRVTVIEKQDGVMGGAEQKITEMVSAELEAHGISLHLSTTVQGFEGKNGKIHSVLTDKGSFPADLALVSLGVRPRSGLAADAGLALGPAKTIQVDDGQRTSIENIWAAGDCAQAFHRVLEKPVFVPLALGANRQGRVAGINMAGGEERFPGILGSAVTRVFDLAIGRTGIDQSTAVAEGISVETAEATASSRAHYMPEHGSVWVKIIYRSDDLRVVGGWLCGHDGCLGKRTDILATAIAANMTVLDVSDLDLSYAPPFAPVWDPVIQAANKARFELAGK